VFVVGADENGLGPLLGPMVATAVTVEVGAYRAAPLRRRGEALGIADSKLTSGFGRMAVAEGLALALAERACGQVPADVDALLAAIALDGALALRAPCPDLATARQCFSEAVPLPAFGGDVAAGRAALAKLEGRALRVRRVRAAIACVGAINVALAEGVSKFALDLAMFERLLLDAAAAAGAPVEGLCGMVGGIRHYPEHTTHFEPDDYRLVASDKGGKTYALPRVGQVRFEIKADRTHLPVALASMVGKYVRELTMARVVRFYRAIDPELTEASGYHDKRTKAFVARAERHLPLLGVRSECFQRNG
jgi:ribonuclease HII